MSMLVTVIIVRVLIVQAAVASKRFDGDYDDDMMTWRTEVTSSTTKMVMMIMMIMMIMMMMMMIVMM